MTQKLKKIKKDSYGKGSRRCSRCGTHDSIIRRYELNICRRCFREVAVQIGFQKY